MTDDHDGLDFPSDWFWSVIAEARNDKARMRSLLEGMDGEVLHRFHIELLDAVAELRDGEQFARYLTRDSEDGAEDVCYWVVSQGEAYYRGVLEYPETIPHDVEHAPPCALHVGIADGVRFDRTGEGFDEY